MYYSLSLLAGAAISLMVAVNAFLTAYYGNYTATVIIHIMGLLLISLIVLCRKEKLHAASRLPWYLYLGGFIGIGTTMFTNYAACSFLNFTSITALSLFGQVLTSIFIDQTGLLNSPKKGFHQKRCMGLAVVLAGIIYMIFPLYQVMLLPIFAALLSGFTNVFSRTVNGELADRTSFWFSTWYNYIFGLAGSLVLLLLLGRDEPAFAGFTLSPKIWIYTGGFIGVMIVTGFSAIIKHIPSLYMTLLLFVGQIFASILLDLANSGTFAPKNLAGGIIIAAGLTLHLYQNREKSVLEKTD